MAVRKHKPAVPWIFVLFTLFSFGTGFLLVSATKYNTEGRSKAFGSPTVDPYNNLLDACPFVVDGHCSITPPGGCNSEGRPAYGNGGGGGRHVCCDGYEPANIGGEAICHKLGSLSPGQACAGLGLDGNTNACQWCPNQDYIDPVFGSPHCRGVGEKTFVEKMVEAGKRIIENKGIQYGSDVVCPEGQTEHRGGRGLVWCE